MSDVVDTRVLTGSNSYSSLGDQISSIVLDQRTHKLPWYGGFALGFLLLNVMLLSLAWLLYMGIGVWGVNVPVGWGFAIINFVWWIGIGHAGTLISAILLLTRQNWRNSINRFAEAMTIFAVMCAGLFPLLHTGRPWAAYWMLPYPNILGAWPQFQSPLIWDVFAVTTYITVSALFWFVGLIPDFATLRDKAKNLIVKRLFGIASFGWRGSVKHWFRYETAYLILAGLSTPLVLSVHSVVSLDFAVSIIPGWHATIFPPYFVAGAIYAGFAMVLLLTIPIRKWYGLEHMITMRHIDWMAKIMLATGLIVFYGYIAEAFYGWYSANEFEWHMMWNNRMTGTYSLLYWSLIFCNGLVPQLLWWPKVRRNTLMLFAISLVVSVGMWLERFIIVVTSLHEDFVPSAWGFYDPTIWDWGLFLGTIGLFTFLMFLFIRYLPMINIFEMKDLLHKMKPGHAAPAVALHGPGGGETQ
ncbi:MAG: polysulfide reductase chain C [Fimbriimonadales bacterium]